MDEAVKEAGYQVISYTVNEPARARELFDWGVDAVFSDCPGHLLSAIWERREAGAIVHWTKGITPVQPWCYNARRDTATWPEGRGTLKALNTILMSGREVLPLVEGGKGISVSNGESLGRLGAGRRRRHLLRRQRRLATMRRATPIPQLYHGKTRRERHEELVAYAIKGGIAQAAIAQEASGGKGRIHMNVLWEMAGAERVLHGVLEGAKGLIHGVTCGAGMPYRIAEICAQLRRPLLPDRLLRPRLPRLVEARLSQVPATGSAAWSTRTPGSPAAITASPTVEDPTKPGATPIRASSELRDVMRDECGLATTPIIMAGGVWWLREWEHWLDNPELGPVAFQFGTRPLLTQESPISEAWKQRLLTLKEGDVFLNRFSPDRLLFVGGQQPLPRGAARAQRAPGRLQPAQRWASMTDAFPVGARGRLVYLTAADKVRAERLGGRGLHRGDAHAGIDADLRDRGQGERDPHRPDQLHGLPVSACLFSNWSQNEQGTTGKKADPRSFCIQKTLQEISHSDRHRRPAHVRRPQRLPLRRATRSTRTASSRR